MSTSGSRASQPFEGMSPYPPPASPFVIYVPVPDGVDASVNPPWLANGPWKLPAMETSSVLDDRSEIIHIGCLAWTRQQLLDLFQLKRDSGLELPDILKLELYRGLEINALVDAHVRGEILFHAIHRQNMAAIQAAQDVNGPQAAWSDDEYQRLVDFVDIGGVTVQQIADLGLMPGRTFIALQEAYTKSAALGFRAQHKPIPWEPEEHEEVLRLHAETHMSFAQMAQQGWFKGRSARQIKYGYEQAIELGKENQIPVPPPRRQTEWTDEKLSRLAELKKTMSYRQISATPEFLGQTEGSLRHGVELLKNRAPQLVTAPFERWTEEELKGLRKLREEEGLTCKQILDRGLLPGRTLSAMKCAYQGLMGKRTGKGKGKGKGKEREVVVDAGEQVE